MVEPVYIYEASTPLSPRVKQYFSAFALVERSVRLRGFIYAHDLIHKADRRPDLAEHVLSTLQEVGREREDGAHGAAPEGQRDVLVEAVPAGEWERDCLVHAG